MVHPYLRRRNGEEEVTYPHPCLQPVLEKTLGIPLFQEQVMRLAVVAADYTAGEADQLRRDMAAWRKSGQIDHHRDRLVNRMMAKGIEREFAERVFEQIRGFGEYGFPESHAASFALISYVTSWLKQHYPAAFMCSLLNAQPMGFYAPATIIDDAKRHGVEVRPIDVSHSAWDCTLEAGGLASGVGLAAVRIGFRYVQGVRAEERELFERAKPPFVSLEDFVTRCPLSEKSLVTLVEAGAFDGLGLSRRAALWEALRLTRTPELPLPSARQQVLPMFDALSVAETIRWDYAASHHSVQGHPLTPLRAKLKQQGMVSGADIQQIAHGTRIDYAGLVICRQRPATAAGVTFMTLEDETGFVNVVLWQKVFSKCAYRPEAVSPD
jgi:error-prone DNA polymerase